MPGVGARYSTAPMKSVCSISWTKVKMSPTSVAAEALVAAGLLADVERRRSSRRGRGTDPTHDRPERLSCDVLADQVDDRHRGADPLDVVVGDAMRANLLAAPAGGVSARSAGAASRHVRTPARRAPRHAAGGRPSTRIPIEAISTIAMTEQREPRRDVVPRWISIFTPTKARMIAEPFLQEREPAVHVGEQEVQGAQAEDGEGVRAEHDELLAAHREDGRAPSRRRTPRRSPRPSRSTANSGVARRSPFSRREQLLPVELVRGRHELVARA